MKSTTHRAVILNPKWNWVGYSCGDFNGTTVSVMNFSDGNLGSTFVKRDGKSLLVTGNFINKPVFRGNYTLQEFEVGSGTFKLRIEPTRDILFIFNYNANGGKTDRIDFFLDKLLTNY